MSIKTMFPFLSLALLAAIATAARSIPFNIPNHKLATMLEASVGLPDCWNALLEIKSCSNETVLFFLNGQAEIGTKCCHAIDVITHNCWPAMLTSLGFTAEEGNILRGYCEASSARHRPAAAPAAAGAPSQYQP